MSEVDAQIERLEAGQRAAVPFAFALIIGLPAVGELYIPLS